MGKLRKVGVYNSYCQPKVSEILIKSFLKEKGESDCIITPTANSEVDFFSQEW